MLFACIRAHRTSPVDQGKHRICRPAVRKTIRNLIRKPNEMNLFPMVVCAGAECRVMELEKQSAGNANDGKPNQLPSEKKSIVLNGHKPIVNPLYDDDEFDVDTKTPFLTALSTVEVAKLDKNGDDEFGNTATNLQTVEDGEILENSNDETGFSDRKNNRSESRSLKNEEIAKGTSKWRFHKLNNYSPERRSSGAHYRGKRERSHSYGDRDQKKKRMKEAAKTRDSMICDKRETKRFVVIFKVILWLSGFRCVWFFNNKSIFYLQREKRPPIQSRPQR